MRFIPIALAIAACGAEPVRTVDVAIDGATTRVELARVRGGAERWTLADVLVVVRPRGPALTAARVVAERTVELDPERLSRAVLVRRGGDLCLEAGPCGVTRVELVTARPAEKFLQQTVVMQPPHDGKPPHERGGRTPSPAA